MSESNLIFRRTTEPSEPEDSATTTAVEAGPGPQANFFNNATVYNDGGIIRNEVHFHNNYPTPESQFLRQLEKARALLVALVVVDAMHTGNVRADPLGCHPETRREVIQHITWWIELAQRDHNILWLFGPAGIGKSAIAKEVADKLDKEDRCSHVAGSFFFWRGDPSRNNFSRLVPTLAYQMAVRMGSDVGKEIDTAISRDSTLLKAELGVQWKKLIVEPVLAATHVLPAAIILDGLDECGDEKAQRRVLELIASCGPTFPVAFFVTSRPEPHILNSFNAESLASLCEPHINLSNYADDQEMYNFIKSSFAAICDQRRDVLGENASWPPDEVIDEIRRRADGLYIYAVTLFKYLDDEDCNPEERLEAFLMQKPGALTALDSLYMQIIKASHNPSDKGMQFLLFLVIYIPKIEAFGEDEETALSGYRGFDIGLKARLTYSLWRISPTMQQCPSISVLSQHSDLSKKNIRIKLRKLHSVLKVPKNDEDKIEFHHTSFGDFLFSSNRSNLYCVTSLTHVLRALYYPLFKVQILLSLIGSFLLSYLLEKIWIFQSMVQMNMRNWLIYISLWIIVIVVFVAYTKIVLQWPLQKYQEKLDELENVLLQTNIGTTTERYYSVFILLCIFVFCLRGGTLNVLQQVLFAYCVYTLIMCLSFCFLYKWLLISSSKFEVFLLAAWCISFSLALLLHRSWEPDAFWNILTLMMLFLLRFMIFTI